MAPLGSVGIFDAQQDEPNTGDNFAVREWLAADADGRDVHDQSLGQGIACDPLGCIGKLPGGGLVAYALSPEAFEDDCSCATLLIASRGDPPADCKATVIDHALWLCCDAAASDLVIESARPKNFDRPWSPAPVPCQARAGGFGESGQAEFVSRARDATPRQEDIEADQ